MINTCPVLLLLNQESVQKLFVGMLLSLLTAMATGAPIAMTAIAQPTQSDAETKSDDQTNEINSQFQNPSSGRPNKLWGSVKISVAPTVA